jgi:hypothetical protein
LNLLREFVLEDLQGSASFRGNQYSLTRSQQVAYQVCDGVALTRAWRPPNQYAPLVFDCLDDLPLLAIRKQGEEDFSGKGCRVATYPGLFNPLIDSICVVSDVIN